MKIAFISIIIVIICFSIGYNYLQYTDRKNLNGELDKIAQAGHVCRNELLGIKQKALLMSQMEIQIPLTTPVLSAQNNTTLQNILKKRTLVYAFSYKDCFDCAKNQLEILSELESTAEIELLILIGYDNIRSFKNYEQMIDSTIPVIGLSDDTVIANQCFFVLERDGTGRNIYIPETIEDGFTKEYLKQVRNKFDK